MLSKLISLLSRIPAVKWAFNRLRPLPHSGSIDLTPDAADKQSAVLAIEEAAPTVDTISAEPHPRDADVALKVVQEATVSPVEVEAAEAAEPNVCSDASPELPEEIEPLVEEPVFVASAELETVPGETSALVIEEPASVASVEAEPVTVDEPAPSVAAEIEPAVASDPPPVAAPLVEDTTDDAPVAAAHIDPAPETPTPKSPAVPKARAKVVEPADRAALIRQRWAETGIRMWNPRLHGTGEATLNIQGRIGLLPPEAGETMPRYDKLEFKMLGGQIVCEGVIVEAPVHAGQRSFTRLAEPRSPDRSREPARERRAALA